MNTLWNKRIPTLFAFTLILIGISVTTYLAQMGAIPFLHAAPEENPQELRITNLTDTSFTITYKTPAAVIGSAVIGTDANFGQVALDDRDQATGTPTQYLLHSITVRNLKPSTKYLYAINSGKTTYLNHTVPFVIITGATITTKPPNAIPIAGGIQLANGEKPSEALVYITTQNAQTVSTLVKANGLYIIPLNNIRTENASSYAHIADTNTVQILATDGIHDSHATLLARQRNPVPLIVLTNNYDFTIDTTPLASNSAPSIGFPVFALDTAIQAEPKIETPTQNETFTDTQPVLKGKALPNETVQIEIHSQQTITQTVTTDQYGNWTYRPTSELAPGQHTLIIKTKDQNGIVRTIQQLFTIFQSGTQVAEAATPSATPVITPTNTPSPTPTIAPTQQPTNTPTPTATEAPTPTSIPSIITPTPAQKIPATGSTSLITIGVITLATTVAGIVLFLISSGISL